MDDTLIERDEGALRVLSMNRPERRNSLNAALTEALLQGVTRAADDTAIGCVLLRGEGPAFCVGGDVKEMNEGVGRALSTEQRIRGLRRKMDAARLLHAMPKPTVAAVRGAAAGAGLSLALACDFRIVGKSAKLTTAFAKVGLSGDYGGSWFLTRIVGTAKARDLYLRPRVLTAAEALDIGMVTEVVEDDDVESRAHELATELAAGPRSVLGFIKQNLNRAEVAAIDEAMDQEALHHVLSSTTEDHREAAAAFVEKRTPRFVGR